MRPRWFGVGLNPTPSFLLCTSCQAQSASPYTYQLFVLVFLSQSLPPCPAIISAALTTIPTSSPSVSSCLSVPWIQLLLVQVFEWNSFLPRTSWGSHGAPGELELHFPHRCVEWVPEGLQQLGAGASTGMGYQCTCSCLGPHTAVIAQSCLDSDGKCKTFRVPKITFPTDFKALFGNIKAHMKKPCTGK